jgi:hypothetical protein
VTEPQLTPSRYFFYFEDGAPPPPPDTLFPEARVGEVLSLRIARSPSSMSLMGSATSMDITFSWGEFEDVTLLLMGLLLKRQDDEE